MSSLYNVSVLVWKNESSLTICVTMTIQDSQKV